MHCRHDHDKVVEYSLCLLNTRDRGAAISYAQKMGYLDSDYKATSSGQAVIKFAKVNEFLAKACAKLRALYLRT